MTIIRSISLLLVVGLFFAHTASAQSAWVSDEFEVTLRTGPSTSNAIELMVSSGTQLQILDEDPEAGYTQVRTNGGTEGWVLTRYLMDEPSAREQLANLTQQLTNANEEGASMGSQLSAIRDEYDSANRTIRELESEHASGMGSSLSREDYVAKGLAVYSRSWQRKALLGIFAAPFIVILIIVALAAYA